MPNIDKILKELEHASQGASSALVEAAKNLILALFKFTAEKNPHHLKQYKAALLQVNEVINSMPKINESDARVLENLGRVSPLKQELKGVASKINNQLVSQNHKKQAPKAAPEAQVPTVKRHGK